MYQRSISQFERQQRRLELEHNELLSKVGRLTDEVRIQLLSYRRQMFINVS